MSRRTNPGIVSVQLGRDLYQRYERAGSYPRSRLLKEAVRWYLEGSVGIMDLGSLYRTSRVDTGSVPLLSADIGEQSRLLIEDIARERDTSSSAVLRAIVRTYLDKHFPLSALNGESMIPEDSLRHETDGLAVDVLEPEFEAIDPWVDFGIESTRGGVRFGATDVDETATITAAIRPLIPSSMCDESHPYGYPDDLVRCVVDSVYSINANYFGHVVPVLNRLVKYRVDHHAAIQTASEFLSEFAPHLDDDGSWLARNVFQNAQRTSTQSGILKARAVVEYIQILRRHGVERPSDLVPRFNDQALQRDLARVPGDGFEGIRRDYLFMLAGRTDLLKWDRQLKRFFERHLGHVPSKGRALEILRAVVESLRSTFPCLTVRSLDRIIWGELSGAGSTNEFEIPRPPSGSSALPITAPPHSSGRESSVAICLNCYRRGLKRYGSLSASRVSRVTVTTYLSDGERFVNFFESGLMNVKGTRQRTTPREFVAIEDLVEFIEALVQGGMTLSSAVVYGTPVRGAFDSLDRACPHRQ